MTKPSGRELTRIGITTGIVHSVFWSTLIYSAEILGIVSFEEPVLRVILIGSFLWGAFGMATVVRREREGIKIEFIDRIVEHYLGINSETQNIFSGIFNYCWFPCSEVGDYIP